MLARLTSISLRLAVQAAHWRRRHQGLFFSTVVLLALAVAGLITQECKLLSIIPTDPGDRLAVPAFLTSPEPITPIPSPPEREGEPAKRVLGEMLFKAPLLSRDNQRSCLSCHDVRSNGADAKRVDKDAAGGDNFFNTNTVFNAALSYRFNWEGNARSLEEQAAMALESPNFMGQSIDDSLRKLRVDPVFRRLFQSVYGMPPDRASLLDAIADYEKSLLTPDSRFDRWLKGDAAALSADELEGYGLFKSLGCVSCHQGVNVGGNLLERHGIFRPLASPKPEMLRVPSLRNVATTPPYFHDGSAPSLDDAVRRMGAAQLNRTLTDEQVSVIVAFLSTLTGTYHGNSVTEPKP